MFYDPYHKDYNEMLCLLIADAISWQAGAFPVAAPFKKDRFRACGA